MYNNDKVSGGGSEWHAGPLGCFYLRVTTWCFYILLKCVRERKEEKIAGDKK